ncbi:MAG TPA: GNAT family N-acetyltransferase [Amycolatopsis sp.]|nr:GNAT family N-acetyltransferase [Amycolatopsis sp.]
MSPLDNPVLASLTGPHAHFAEQQGEVLRYPADVSPFVALPDDPDEQAWRDLAALAGPGTTQIVAGPALAAPPGWPTLTGIPGVQMEGSNLTVAPDPEAVRLTDADVPEMLDLVERTRPGPFLKRTIALGTYLGLRRDGALVAMAGERFHAPGWTEISAVCTDPAFRGQGLAARLVRAVGAGIRARGEQPFLHAAEANTGAICLYEAMGFRLNRKLVFTPIEVPGA